MSAAELKAKKASVDSGQTVVKIEQLETEWIQALLLRAKISQEMLDRRASGLSNSDWRTLLLRDFGISIEKNLQTGTVCVWKYNEKTTIKAAEWSKPQITRIKKEGKTVCELVLKFWQLL